MNQEIKEAIESLTKDVIFWDNEGGGKIAEMPTEDYEQALAKLRKAQEQPPAGEFTRRFRILLATQDKTAVVQDGYKLCDRLDRSEVELKRINAGWAMESQLRENLLQENYKYEMKIKELKAAIAKEKEGGE